MPQEGQADAWQNTVENRFEETGRRLERMEGKIDRYFGLGIIAVAGIAVEVFWAFNILNEKITALQLAVHQI